MNGKYDFLFAVVMVAIWGCAGVVLVSCEALSPRVANRDAEDHSTTDGPATHTETEVHAGRDAITHTTTIVQSTPWLLAAISATGWTVAYRGRRLRDRVAKLTVAAIEANECSDCKRVVAMRGDASANRYIEHFAHGCAKGKPKGKLTR